MLHYIKMTSGANILTLKLQVGSKLEGFEIVKNRTVTIFLSIVQGRDHGWFYQHDLCSLHAYISFYIELKDVDTSLTTWTELENATVIHQTIHHMSRGAFQEGKFVKCSAECRHKTSKK